MFAPTSFTDTLLSFSSLPFDTGLTLAWETRLRGQENALWYLQHLIFAGGMALVLTLRASAASWLNLALLSKVLIHMKSFTFLLPWKWGEDQDFNYFSEMSDSNQWHFLRVSSSLPDLMLIRAAFIQSLVMKLHLTQLFQMVSVKRDSYLVWWSGAGLHWHASYPSSKSIHVFYCNSMKFILQLFFPKNGTWKGCQDLSFVLEKPFANFIAWNESQGRYSEMKVWKSKHVQADVQQSIGFPRGCWGNEVDERKPVNLLGLCDVWCVI